MSYENGIKSRKEIFSLYKLNDFTLGHWRYNYNKYGIEGLQESKTSKYYTKELKENAVRDCISGKLSQREIARKHEISKKLSDLSPIEYRALAA